jgi:hypothetical protein
MNAPLKGELPPATLVADKSRQGWKYVATEFMTVARPSLDDRSSEIPLQAEVEIKHKYGGSDREVQYVCVATDVMFPTDPMTKLAPESENKLCYIFTRERK